MAERKIPLIIDTDPGIDDAAAIFWVLGSKKFDIKAFTVTNGNVGIDKTVTNMLRLLEVTKCTDIPVYRGAYRPLIRKTIDASWVHGQDGMGDAGLPMPTIKETPGFAPAEMVRIAKESKEPVTILALGPITNVALAILLDPTFKDHVKEVLFMGGAIKVFGNDAAVSSFNVTVDPEAANVVYNSGIRVVQLGLDICDKFTELKTDIDMIVESGSEVGRFLGKMCEKRLKFEMEKQPSKWYVTRSNGIGFNDVACTGYLFMPELYKTELLPIDIEISGKITSGMTVADVRGWWKKEPNVLFAYDVDSRPLVENWRDTIISFAEKK